MSLLKNLPIALLLLFHRVHADHQPDDEIEPIESSNDLGQRIWDTSEMRTNIRKNIENFVLLSINYPSSMSFRMLNDDNRQVSVTLERKTSSEIKKCSFQPFDDELSVYNVKLRSLTNNIEIFEAIKTYKDSTSNMMDVFVINMTDCKFTKNTIMKGYDFKKNRGAYVVLNQRNDKSFEIFWMHGKDECGAYICRRRYWLENSTMSEPMRFELLNEKPEGWRLIFLAASNDGGYFSLIKQKSAVKLLSLSADGNPINSLDQKSDSKLRFLRISTANDEFGACYVEDKSPNKAQCFLLDRQLKMNFNKTLDLEGGIDYLTMYNLPQDGFILMSASCNINEKRDRCDNYNMKVTKYRLDGSSDELRLLKEESCMPRRRQAFKFFEDMDGKLCMFWACNCGDRDSALCEEMMRMKCIGHLRDF